VLQTADADATIAAEEAVMACLLAFGSSSCFAAAAATDSVAAAVETAAGTAVSGSSFFCFAVAAASAVPAMDADAIVDATMAADAN
jgi:hypothetical protein